MINLTISILLGVSSTSLRVDGTAGVDGITWVDSAKSLFRRVDDIKWGDCINWVELPGIDKSVSTRAYVKCTYQIPAPGVSITGNPDICKFSLGVSLENKSSRIMINWTHYLCVAYAYLSAHSVLHFLHPPYLFQLKKLLIHIQNPQFLWLQLIILWVPRRSRFFLGFTTEESESDSIFSENFNLRLWKSFHH